MNWGIHMEEDHTNVAGENARYLEYSAVNYDSCSFML